MGGKFHATDKKTGGRHTTLTEPASKVYDFIKKIPAVSSVTAGQIKMNLPSAPHRVIIKEISGCLSIKVRGTKSIQELKVYSRDLPNVKEVLEKKFL